MYIYILKPLQNRFSMDASGRPFLGREGPKRQATMLAENQKDGKTKNNCCMLLVRALSWAMIGLLAHTSPKGAIGVERSFKI